MVDCKSGLSIPGRGHILCKGPGAWGLAGGQHGGEGPLPETFRTHWRKQAWRQHFIPEGHWLSCRH